MREKAQCPQQVREGAMQDSMEGRTPGSSSNGIEGQEEAGRMARLPNEQQDNGLLCLRTGKPREQVLWGRPLERSAASSRDSQAATGKCGQLGAQHGAQWQAGCAGSQQNPTQAVLSHGTERKQGADKHTVCKPSSENREERGRYLKSHLSIQGHISGKKAEAQVRPKTW